MLDFGQFRLRPIRLAEIELAEVEIGRSQNWKKSKLEEVEIGRSRNWPNSKKKAGRSRNCPKSIALGRVPHRLGTAGGGEEGGGAGPADALEPSRRTQTESWIQLC